ncbi:GDP-mannose 4,6-dehydratase [Candidatus Woesearchaeota archaeon]|nr:GDP-mannose 4,6-dehydratase [Candidatus Woesearchaeota archaeon]
MKTILVTGGAGFIGSHVCDALISRGDKVVCIDNFNDYYDPSFKHENIQHNIGKKNFVLVKGDFTEHDLLRGIFVEHKIDVICHLGARAGVRPSIEQPLLYEEVNVKGTLNLLECAREFSVKHFVFASSSSVYGDRDKVPFSETDNVEHPISPYAATKRTGELMCYTYHHLYGIKCTCLRFFTVYGPRGRPDMAPYKFVQWVTEGKELTMFGDGSTKRDYTYIADIVSGVVACIDKQFDYEIINLGNNNPVSLKEFISIVENLVGKKAIIKKMPMQPGDVSMTYADVSKAGKLLGYKPTTSFAEGMKKFVEWYRSNR